MKCSLLVFQGNIALELIWAKSKTNSLPPSIVSYLFRNSI